MIQVNVEKKQGNYRKFSIDGHAEYITRARIVWSLTMPSQWTKDVLFWFGQ